MSSMRHRAKHILRPLVPDSVMARYRRHQHSKGIRSNVDLYVRDRRLARAFLSFTPDTYRVVSDLPVEGTREGVDRMWFGPVDDRLIPYLGHHGSEAVVAATVGRPRMRSMRIVEPDLAVSSVVTTGSVLDAVGGDPSMEPDTVARLLTTGGARVGVLPTVRDGFHAVHGRISGDVVVVLAAVPLHDIGGGSRAAQITFELLRRGYRVVYVDAFPSSEAVDLGLRYPHPNLWQTRLPDLGIADVIDRTDPGVVIVEAPMGDFVEPVAGLAAAGWRIVYDVIDDWSDEALGGMWYARVFEESIVDLADGYTASAPDLVERVTAFGHDAVLVPNAVNADVFTSPDDGRPADLPAGPVLGYHGSLYGNWFDWDTLRRVAVGYPDHAVVVIGDARTVPTDLPRNVRFLGLKPQGALPAYLRRFEVGLVPFTVTDVTHAVSPLKVYEYLACGVPVAAPPLRSLEGLDGVFVDTDLVAAIGRARSAYRPDPAHAIAEHSWGARVAAMLGTVGVGLRGRDGSALNVVTRPPVRYPLSERWIR